MLLLLQGAFPDVTAAPPPGSGSGRDDDGTPGAGGVRGVVGDAVAVVNQTRT